MSERTHEEAVEACEAFWRRMERFKAECPDQYEQFTPFLPLLRVRAAADPVGFAEVLEAALRDMGLYP